MKDNKTKVITIAALVIAIIALSIGFAAFSSTLNIQTSASVTPTNTFSVKFASGITGANGEFTQFSVTPTVAVTSTSDNGAQAGTPEIDNSDVRNPKVGNLLAAFTQPGQSVTYTFYVVNDGNYDAYLTNFVFNNAQGANSFRDCVSDSLSSNPATQSLVDNVCSNITFTMSVGNDTNISSSTRLTNHLLQKDHYETVIVTIAYTGEVYADGAFKVNFGDINLNYRTIDEVEEISNQDTPLSSTYSLGDIYTGDFISTQAGVLTGYKGNGGNITIPDTLPVVEASESTFNLTKCNSLMDSLEWCTEAQKKYNDLDYDESFDENYDAYDMLVSMVLDYTYVVTNATPQSITSIGNTALMLSNITSVTFTNNITSIGMGAFSTNNITTLDIPSSVITIKDGAFSENQDLTTVTIHNTEGTVDIDEGAFPEKATIDYVGTGQ